MVLEHSFTALFWSIAFYLVALSFRYFKEFDGLGFGDVKLMIGIGLWLGFVNTQLTVLWATLSAVIFILATTLITGGGSQNLRNQKIAFGAFLSFYTWLFWLASQSS
jgi:leader peptidase (prepilin peptidase)/N-methyltransferase